MITCPHCPPTAQRHHSVGSRFFKRLSLLIDVSINALVPAGLYRFLARHVPTIFLGGLKVIGLVKFDANPPEGAFHNRSRIFFDEAQKRNIVISAIRCFGRYTGDFCVTHKNRWTFYQDIPLQAFPCPSWIDDKWRTKKFFMKQRIPHAEGACLHGTQTGIAYGKHLGFPLVVKPRAGSLSAHATYPVKDEASLLSAIRIAQEYETDFIIERFIPGELYRLSVIGQRDVFACHKEAPNVVGDGRRTVAELIQEKNKHPWRGGADDMTTLHHLTIDESWQRTEPFCHPREACPRPRSGSVDPSGVRMDSRLRENDACRKRTDFVPKQGEKVYLSNKAVLSLGCDIHACTENVHPDIRALCIHIAELIQAEVMGIDIICSDIGLSWKDQTFAVLELNSLPYVDMHQYPSHGQPAPIAEIVWDRFLEKI